MVETCRHGCGPAELRTEGVQNVSLFFQLFITGRGLGCAGLHSESQAEEGAKFDFSDGLDGGCLPFLKGNLNRVSSGSEVSTVECDQALIGCKDVGT